MDPLQLEQGTHIDNSLAGVSISTGKPTYAGGVSTLQPPLGFMNPPPDLKDLLGRYELFERKVFNSTTSLYELRVNKTFIQGIGFAFKTRSMFNNTILALGYEFMILVHSPFNVNGLLGAWFDPGTSSYYTKIEAEQIASTTSDFLTEAMNLKAVFVNLSDPKEVRLEVPIDNPINTINDLPADYTFGTLKIAVLTGPYFGSGVSQFEVEIYARPIQPLVHPLHGV